jgi:FKBP-type peptidyl-prolyl cis-trans isomerase FklB
VLDLSKAKLGAAFSLIFVFAGCEPSAVAENAKTPQNDKKPALTGELEQASYLLGYMQTKGLISQTSGAIELNAFVAGAADAANGQDSQIDPTQQQQLMTALNEAVTEKRNAASAGVIAEGDKFRAAYAAHDGVVTLPSGMLYEVITAGDGAKPTRSDTVKTHYHGTLIDGTVFDSSVDRGQPASFPVGGVIAGWTEALQLMGVGSKWKLVIPPELAYGERGAGGAIPPNATLVFEVELLEIQ